MRMVKLVLLWGLLAPLVLTGCAGMPTQEMSDARQAVAAARDAGAADHAPRILDNAELQLSKARGRLLRGAWDKARSAALNAKQGALDAREVAVALAAALAVIQRAKQEGRDVVEAEKIVERAQQQSQAGEAEEAVRLAKEAAARAGGGTP